VSASPVAGSTAVGTSGDLAAPHSRPSPAAPAADAPAPAETAGAFRGTVRLPVIGEPARRYAATQSELSQASRNAPASGWATDRDATAAGDLVAGDLVGAYGIASPDTAADAQVTIVSPSPLAAPRPRSANARRRRPANEASFDALGVLDRTGHGARGPQGGVQWTAGGGGAATPLARPVGLELLAQPCLRFTPRPARRLVGMQGRRLERPG
jgi:hypothetical protein